MSSSAEAAYTETKKKEATKKTIAAPQNMQTYHSHIMGLPPRRGEPPVAVVVVTVPAKKDDKAKHCAACDESGKNFMPMKRHQHSFAL
jgi:hypothetical protein